MTVQNNHYLTSMRRIRMAERFDVDYFRSEFISLDDMLDRLPNVQSLGKLAEVEYGFMPTEDYALPDTGTPLIRVTNILSDGSIDMSNVKYVRTGSPRLSEKLVKENDILMVQCGNTTGKLALVSKELEGFAYASFCFRIRPITDEITPEYLFAVLFSSVGYRQVWRSITYATVRPNTTKPYTEAIKIPVPPRAVQNRIAQVMQDAYATRRAKLAAAEQISSQINDYILQQLNVNLAAVEQKRTALKPIRAIAGARFDFEAVVTISELRHNLTHGTTLRDVVSQVNERILPVESCPEDDIHYIGLADIESHTGELVNLTLTRGSEILSSSPVFQEGDMLFGRMRPYLNKAWLATFGGVCSGEAIVLRPNEQKVDPVFLHALLLSRITLDQVVPLQSGTSLPRVSASDVLNINLPVPDDLQQQKEIGAEITRRRDDARRLRAEAETVVAEAKARVERMILGEEAP